MKLGKVAATVVVAMTLVAPAASAAPDGSGVRRVEYSLGDRAFQVPGFLTGPDGTVADLELTAVVHAPRTLVGKRPLMMLAHGYWESCVNKVEQWPCPAGDPFPSYRGYDYLGEELARQGFVVVSVSANGINAGITGQISDVARAALMNKHLEMWRDLNDGTGPLVERLHGFQGHVDLTNVGTLGHSRGGRGVVYQASDQHVSELPRGVRIRAVLPLAPAGYYRPDPDAPQNLDYRITKIPFAVVTGDCDSASMPTQAPMYIANALGRNEVPFHQVTPRRANHNFFNTEWSYDHDNFCTPGPTLTPEQQRKIATTYVSAFFQQYLNGRNNPIVSEGNRGVDVVTHRPVR
ncbi:alpha/beta hydrolase family protein [Lentzea sp. NPDC060358]|uniref:alpha/beta hydrolase family protein n=1 Tax=Lentzea sp. NPDC060358 TaxID=3347103 RepID=UPI00364F14F6